MAADLYPLLVWFHIILFTFWLGADLGVAGLGQAFRDRSRSLETRLAILRLLTVVDLGPRTAWALMVPSTLALVSAGGFWAVPAWGLAASWILAAGWLWLVWTIHAEGQTPRAALLKSIEFWLKVALGLFYAWLGAASVATGAPLAQPWLAWKALTFAAIFACAIMIDVGFRAVGPPLGALIAQGSSDATEIPLRRAMDATRVWVWAVYALLVVVSLLGTLKPA